MPDLLETDPSTGCLERRIERPYQEKAKCGSNRDPVLEYHLIREKAVSYLLEFQAAKVCDNRAGRAGSNVVRWRPPSPNSYKINFDGAVFSEVEAAGLGAVIRDSNGSVIGSLAERVPLPSLVTTVEALACRRALMFAKELRISEAVFEGDAEIIINALNGGVVCHPEFGLVIQDCLVLAAGFGSCKFEHIRRVGNSVAHFLARRSKFSLTPQVWLEFIPEDLVPLVSRDSL